MDTDQTQSLARTQTVLPEQVAAHLLTMSLGSGTLPLTEALEALRQRISELEDPTAALSLSVLKRQLPVLEATWQRMTYEALTARKASDKAQLLRAALQAQQAYARTFALLRTLAQQDSQTALTLDDDSDK